MRISPKADGLRIAALLLLTAVLPACSGTDRLFGSGAEPETTASTSPSLADRMSNLFGSTRKAAAEGGGPVSSDDIDCPNVDIRPGSSTLAIAAKGADSSAMDLRYQATIGRTARECALLGATITIKVGVQGRVVIGPNGGPGQVDIPLRYALVHEGPEPKTILTKLHRFPVTIGQGQTGVGFTHIEEDLTIPVPDPIALQSYVVYVGFDPAVPKPAEKKPAKKPEKKRTAEPR
jgi:hypothetical protein